MKLFEIYSLIENDDEDEEHFKNTVPNPFPVVDSSRLGEADEYADELVDEYMEQHSLKYSNENFLKARGQVGKVMDVPMHEIVSTEDRIYPDRVKSPSNELPYMVFLEGDYIVLDGNHRVVNAFLNKKTSIKALVIC